MDNLKRIYFHAFYYNRFSNFEGTITVALHTKNKCRSKKYFKNSTMTFDKGKNAYTHIYIYVKRNIPLRLLMNCTSNVKRQNFRIYFILSTIWIFDI